jgi:hypothetical protein
VKNYDLGANKLLIFLSLLFLQLNSYEEDGEMHLDMLVYDDSSIYDKATFIDSIMENVSN